MRRSAGSKIWKWMKRFLAVFMIIIATPFVLVVVYAGINPPVSSFMMIKAFEGNGINFVWRPIDKISPHLVRAVVTSEDARFCSHKGVDWKVMDKLVNKALAGKRKRLRGGSTVTMQTAKNLFLWPGRSYVRKGFEMVLAYWIDFVWPKQRVIEVYLNIAEWAPGIYGAQAAARHHFGKSSLRLSRREAALLAVSLPNPVIRNAGSPGPKTRRLARRLSRRVNGTIGFMGCLTNVLKKR